VSRLSQPEIFNTEQGSQFSAEAFTSVLLARGAARAAASTTFSSSACGARTRRLPERLREPRNISRAFEPEGSGGGSGTEREAELLKKIGELKVERHLFADGLGRLR